MNIIFDKTLNSNKKEWNKMTEDDLVLFIWTLEIVHDWGHDLSYTLEFMFGLRKKKVSIFNIFNVL